MFFHLEICPGPGPGPSSSFYATSSFVFMTIIYFLDAVVDRKSWILKGKMFVLMEQAVVFS